MKKSQGEDNRPKGGHEDPLVSVITPAYNAAHSISETLDSVLAQTYKNIEVIVVDDGSKDNTAEVVKDYGDRGVVYVHQQNAGVSAARANGVAHARGKYISFIDADDLYLPEKIEKQVAFMESHPACDVSYCGIYHFYESKPDKLLFLDREYYSGDDVFPHLLEKFFINLLSIMYRRELVDRIGNFDPEFRRSEDWEYCTRLAYAGARFCYFPERLAKYRMNEGGTSLSTSNEAAEKLSVMNIFIKLRTIMSKEDRKKYHINRVIFRQRLKYWYARAGEWFPVLRKLHRWQRSKRFVDAGAGA